MKNRNERGGEMENLKDRLLALFNAIENSLVTQREAGKRHDLDAVDTARTLPFTADEIGSLEDAVEDAAISDDDFVSVFMVIRGNRLTADTFDVEKEIARYRELIRGL